MLMMGNKQRTCEPTAANLTSSRSHAILQVRNQLLTDFFFHFCCSYQKLWENVWMDVDTPGVEGEVPMTVMTHIDSVMIAIILFYVLGDC